MKFFAGKTGLIVLIQMVGAKKAAWPPQEGEP